MNFRHRVQAAWFHPDLAVFLWPLLPLSWLFRAVVTVRTMMFRSGLLTSDKLPVPVVVVGNLIVGGAGKTPAVLWLTDRLRAAGWRPGILSRGYGAAKREVRAVRTDGDARLYGDEPVLLANRSGVPVFVGRRRAEAGRALLAAHPEVDILVCDDGLQHYGLARDLEIVVFDRRGGGNGRMLPAGPLREPESRLSGVDAIVFNEADDLDVSSLVASGAGTVPQFRMQLLPGELYALRDTGRRVSAARLAGRDLHAIAGIGHPERFLSTLKSLGLTAQLHSFPDHHAYVEADLAFVREGVLLMTEKDAIKCRAFYAGEAWVLPVSAKIEPDLAAFVLERIDGRQAA